MRLTSDRAFDAVNVTTLAGEVVVDGVGLHSGAPVTLRIKPGVQGEGVVFRRIDAPDPAARDVPAHASEVAGVRLGTRLENGAGMAVQTVEHVLAGLALSGVDDAIVELDAEEAPIVDGSAAPFAAAVAQAGVVVCSKRRRYYRISTALEVRDGERFVRVEPFDGRAMAVSIAFEDPAIGAQAVELNVGDARARERLMAARTFCRLADVDSMRAAGFAQGGSPENAIIVDGARVLTPGGLRDPQEFALHKALDLVGDLSLAGAPIIGRVIAHRCGHDLNTRLARLVRRHALGAVDTAA